MSLCHLYNTITNSEHIPKILDTFEEVVSLDVNKIDSLDKYDIYIVELQDTDKEVSKKTKKLFEDKDNPLIYFVIIKDYNLILFQLAIFLQVKYLITKNQDIDQVIQKIRSDKKKIQKIEVHEDVNSNNAVCSTSSCISHRLGFVEILKNKLIEKGTSNNKLSVITVGIKDEKRLQENSVRLDIESFLSGLISYIDLRLKEKIVLSQYDRDFYVAFFEGIEFEDIKKIAHNFYSDVVTYIEKKEFVLLVDIFVFNLEGFKFAEVLDKLDMIDNKDIYKDDSRSYIQRISTFNIEIDEISVLKDAFENRMVIKLFNIYNGLCIHTGSRIVKIKEGLVYITFEQLQGVMMKTENVTIIQSSSFPKDIEAKIHYIDFNKRIAILKDFKFLEENANSRKYSRVTPYGNILVSISLDGLVITGSLIDLSIKSIAIRAKYTKKIEALCHKDVKVIFNIPNKNEEYGYTKIVLDATAVFRIISEDKLLCKLVCDFSQESSSESLLIEYVYERQKELIAELKKMVKLH